MTGLTDNLEPIANQVRAELTAKDAAREKALPLCREAIRHCSNSIRAVHRREFDSARDWLKSARNLIGEAELALGGYDDLRHSSLIKDAQKEFVEGSIVLALATREPLPGPRELAAEASAYLNGLGEAVGELRRYLLDNLRRGDMSQGEELLSAMDDIYSVLVTVDFPDAVTGGLRRTTDMVRGVLEKTRSDLTLAIRQKELETKLGRLEENIR